MIAIAETSDPTDLAAVLKVLHAAFRAHEGRIDPPSAVYRETAETLTAKLATETLLVARDEDGRVVGCIFYRQDSADEAYIGRLAVVPEQQRRGTASGLVEASIELARQAGLQRVGLNVRIELTENVRFFERHGFAITREERHPGYDRATNYRMELSLQPVAG
jgi:ribosomal protein S18 acetylase RimI-like enzyme